MQPLKAQSGRSVGSSRVSRPFLTGEVVYLQPVDGLVVVDRDDMADDREALHAELEASIADADAGQTEDFKAVIAAVRQQR
jgi:hypothetical protein